MTGRYFEGDFPELVRRLEDHFARSRAAYETLGRQGAMVLGGGYGRGEGGVMAGPEGPGFSNDLDYFLFDPEPGDPALNAWCRELEKRESEVLGIDVEIKCLRPDSLGDPSRSMMFADLVADHVVVAGDAGFLADMRKSLDFSRIEAAEATRLLWNRGSGLFFARCRLAGEREAGFVIRNHAKLKLALGDAWLCLNGRYTSKCRERAARIATESLPDDLAWLKTWHEEGTSYKFQPFASGPTWADLREESSRLAEAWGRLYLLVERKRLGLPIANFATYLDLPRLLPGSPVWKNFALALRDRLKRGAALRPAGDYPRAGLMRALPCLLELTSGGAAETGRFLPRPTDDPARPGNWEKTYAKWWVHYS
jgi:hypothetical protein